MKKSRKDTLSNLDRFQRALEDSDFDAVVAVSPENVRYLADVHISTQQSIRDRLAFVVWTRDSKVKCLVCQIESGYVERESWIDDVRTYHEFSLDPIQALARLLEEMGLGSGRIGVERSYLPARSNTLLEDICPRARFSDAEWLFVDARMVKTKGERDLIVSAFHATELAFLETMSATHAGTSEKRLANRMAGSLLHHGADMVAFNHINAGRHTGYPHMTPSHDYLIQDGDLVKGDCGGLFREYYSNVGRTAKVGPVTAEERDRWSRLRDVHRGVIERCRPGVTGAELFAYANAQQSAAGLPYPHAHNGHSIGLNLHERPVINAMENIPLQAGMITTVETRHREFGRVGLHMEDIVEITDGTPIWHAKHFINDEIFEIGADR